MKDSRPTSLDIAYRAGVSQSTVSRALRDSPLVSLETREKIKAIARELNYKVDKAASNLRAKSSRTLALLIREDPTTDESHINPFFLSMLGSITRATAAKGYDLLVSFQQQSEDWHRDFEDSHRADGLILLGYGAYDSYVERLRHLLDAGAHFICWGAVHSDQPGCSIGCDNEEGGYLAGRHLVDAGRTRIAFLGDTSDNSPEFSARYRGFCRALEEAGITHSPELLVAAETIETLGYEAVQNLLARGVEFDAVFAASDLIAIGALRALQKAGKRVGQDVAVVGFDDIQSAAYITPSLTTIRQDTNLAGTMLVDNLLRIVAGEPVESTLMPPKLIVRESCGAGGE
ncbi:LacI family DNA-binding transcriptional regulator [Simiduia aestuariiviva]|uniref:DNA-binding LacI/PurR family transcriptional regulator n=1 Tax=Simiduia aestuariiviva TaxID=1510459 RepID=A0A839UPI4_9GAMM|nr:LacI family DNA-binding transcriptional regulator [Simiduia aestuariiviva]MBB3167295.1 DNA-binding LacI/PurR family transcriptional regulator [Simiduia aestuariiviva]